MNFAKHGAWLFILGIFCLIDGDVVGSLATARAGNHPQPFLEQAGSAEVQLITADELKTRMAKNEPLTIVDVRSTNSYIESGDKIKGAIHVKLRRLRSRLASPPLKTVPRDRETITYCACPSDQASIEAAKVLMAAGFKRVRVLKGGWLGWLKTNGPVEPRPKG